MSQELTFSVPTLFGVEGLTADELRRLGLDQVRAENGRVFCQGAALDLARLNLNLRTGERVLLVLGSFPAQDFDALFEGTRALPWERFIPREGQFPVKGHSLNSALHSVPACQSIVKKAIAARLGAKYGLNTLPETGALYQVQFSIMGDEAVLMLDTSGAGLHKRGYRAQGVAAPLRETLAAAMVILSRYRGRDPLCDPFCGSGTIPIEAALIAKNRAPGLNRTFSAQKWAFVDKKLWLQAADEAMDKEFHGDYEIWGGDLDPAAVELARHNAALAEVDDVVRFDVDDARTFHWGGLYGRVVTNPPYGERIMERREAEELYRAFGRAWSKFPEGWKLYLLSSHTEFERTFGKKADKKRKLYNGMLKCDLFMYLERCAPGRRRRSDAGKGGVCHPPYFYHQPRRREAGDHPAAGGTALPAERSPRGLLYPGGGGGQKNRGAGRRGGRARPALRLRRGRHPQRGGERGGGPRFPGGDQRAQGDGQRLPQAVRPPVPGALLRSGGPGRRSSDGL